MDDESFWGPPGLHNPSYSQALRQFIRYHTDSQSIREIQRLASDQAALERKWFTSRQELKRNGANEAKLRDFDRRIHFQASKFSENVQRKLGESLNLTLFLPTAEISPTCAKDRAKFMDFLSDFIRPDPN